MSLSQTLFKPVEPKPDIQRTGTLKLGDFSMSLDLCDLPDNSGYYLYFRLNDHPKLVRKAAGMVAEKIKSLNYANPYFVTPEASTIGMAQLLRDDPINLDGAIIYKTKTQGAHKINYTSITSKKEKSLFINKKQVELMKGKDIILLDSICTTGNTMKAMYQLLIDAGIESSQIKQVITLFNEGEPREELIISKDIKLNLFSFSSLPLYHIPRANIKIGVVGSESAIKLSAIRDSLQQAVPGNKWEVKGVPAQSGKPEQPEEQETLEGAINRANHALEIDPDCDLVIAIESGLFKIEDPKAQEGYSYFDKAVIYCLTKDGQSHITYSDLVQFPTNAVEEARSGNSFVMLPIGPVDYSKFAVNQLNIFQENNTLHYLVKDDKGKIYQDSIEEGFDNKDKLSPDQHRCLKNLIDRNLDKVIFINDKILSRDEVKVVRALFDITAKRGHTTRRGFDKCTVGMVMEDWGIVKSNKDPHLSLSGKPRAEYLKKAALLLCNNLFNIEPAPVHKLDQTAKL